MSFKPLFLLAGLALLMVSCKTTQPDVSGQIAARKQAIAQEPRGDYYIGRRFHISRTQFWGYVRRPGQSWDESRLVIMNESRKFTPDRIPEEAGPDGRARGYDHNAEYRLYGNFSGARVYDPNSDLVLPEFVLTRYELLKSNGGWLFNPNERFNGRYLLRVEPGAATY